MGLSSSSPTNPVPNNSEKNMFFMDKLKSALAINKRKSPVSIKIYSKAEISVYE